MTNCPNCAVKDRQIAAQAAIIAELSGDPDQIILDEMIAGYERSLREMKDRKVSGGLLCEPYDPFCLPRRERHQRRWEAIIVLVILGLGAWGMITYARSVDQAVSAYEATVNDAVSAWVRKQGL